MNGIKQKLEFWNSNKYLINFVLIRGENAHLFLAYEGFLGNQVSKLQDF